MSCAITFIIASPEDDASMMSEPLNCGFRLLFQNLPEGIIFRVTAASHHKVLPDEDSFAAAALIEFFGLINSAAPDTNHIAIQIQSHVNDGIISLFAFGMKTISGDVITSEDTDRNFVDIKLEIGVRSSSYHGVMMEADPPDPCFKLFFCKDFTG